MKCGGKLYRASLLSVPLEPAVSAMWQPCTCVGLEANSWALKDPLDGHQQVRGRSHSSRWTGGPQHGM